MPFLKAFFAPFMIVTFFISYLFAMDRDQCIKLFPNCSMKPPSVDVHALQIQCEANRTLYRCDEMKKKAKPEDQNKFFTCDDPFASGDLCDQQAKDSTALVITCGGAGVQVVVDAAMGIIHLPGMLWKQINLNFSSLKAFKSCSEDMNAKLVLLGPLRPKAMTDATISRLSCQEVKKFARQKAEIILERLEKRRQKLATEIANDNVKIYDLDLTDDEKQALNYSAKNAGKLEIAKCFRSDEAAKLICKEFTSKSLSGAASISGLGALRALSMGKAISAAATVETKASAIASKANVIPESPVASAPTPTVTAATVSPTALTLQTQNFALANTPKINIQSVKNLSAFKNTSNAGVNSKQLLEGVIDSEPVFIKVSNVLENGQVTSHPALGVTYEKFVQDVAWTQRMSDLDIGPKFKGITTQEGHMAIVTENIPGVSLPVTKFSKLDASVKSSAELIESLEKIKTVIQTEGIYAFDLQLKLKGNKAVVIDPGLFKPAQSVAQIDESVKTIDLLISRIKAAK